MHNLEPYLFCRATSIFFINVEQKDGSSKVGLRSTITLVDAAGMKQVIRIIIIIKLNTFIVHFNVVREKYYLVTQLLLVHNT